jgi:hypothetical protein
MGRACSEAPCAELHVASNCMRDDDDDEEFRESWPPLPKPLPPPPPPPPKPRISPVVASPCQSSILMPKLGYARQSGLQFAPASIPRKSVCTSGAKLM